MVHFHQELQGREFNFRDVAMVPSKMSEVARSDVDLSTYATRRLKTYLPFFSAPMDTVTEAPMAIAIELLGGIGVIHYNFRTIGEQIEQLASVKNYKAAFVRNPLCLRPDNTVSDVYHIHKERGFYSVPITEDGTANSRLLGFVSHRDVRYQEETPGIPLKDVMTPRQELFVAHRRGTLDQPDLKAGIKAANSILAKHKLDRLVIIDDEDKPCALVTDRDLRLHNQYPNASVDENKQLYGFVAIKGSWHDREIEREEMERIDKAMKAGVDCFIIEQGVVYASQPKIARYIKETYSKSDIQVGVGNVASKYVVRELIEQAGKYIDLVKVGVGPGAACKTTQALQVGRYQPSAVYECAQELKSLAPDIPLNADGGLKTAGNIALVLALGAQSAMMGSLLAGFDESAGPIVTTKAGKRVKKYRGMGSVEAMEAGGRARYDIGPGENNAVVEEGNVLEVDSKGNAERFLTELTEGVRQSMSKQGFANIKEFQEGCVIYPYKE